MKIESYIEENKARFFEELASLIRIESVSSHTDKKPLMYKCAQRWCELLIEAGADKAEVLETRGNPVAVASKIVDKNLPTVMVYGHYDVMPAEPFELWDTPPFEPTIKDGKLFARGADDDKGQSFIQAKAFEYLAKTNQLKCNVKFIIEGEEEIGSPNLEEFCQNNKELLACDTILVSDTSMLAQDIPSITTGLRGLGYWEIEVSCANKDLHSGIFGGAVANPIIELSKIIAQLIDKDGKITIPHFYDDVQEVSKEERELMAKTPMDEDEYKAGVGVKELHGEKGYTTLERTGIRPTLDICGIWGGYTGEGSKTVLPAKAFAKLSTRLVPNQKYKHITKLVEEYIPTLAPSYIDIKVTPLHGAESYVCPIDSQEYKAAEIGYEKAFGKVPVPVRRGGSIGVVPVFEKVLGVKPILMGFGLESNAIHSPNENFILDMYRKGFITIVEFYNQYCK